jgi:hypothetical protein
VARIGVRDEGQGRGAARALVAAAQRGEVEVEDDVAVEDEKGLVADPAADLRGPPPVPRISRSNEYDTFTPNGVRRPRPRAPCAEGGGG